MGARRIFGAAFDYPAGATIDPHVHTAHQLIYAASGVMNVKTPLGTWIVPPNRALWVAAGCEHAIRTIGTVRMRTLYLSDVPPGSILGECAVVHVAPVLRELILRLIAVQTGNGDAQREEHLIAVIADELQMLETQPLHLPLPSDPVLRELSRAVQADPGSVKKSSEWALEFGISAKTLERNFLREVGMTFGKWRQQVRLLASLERIASGEPVTSVALDLGYQSPSSFAAMFHKSLGKSPSKYFDDSATPPA